MATKTWIALHENNVYEVLLPTILIDTYYNSMWSAPSTQAFALFFSLLSLFWKKK
jgi:hypothetical protein